MIRQTLRSQKGMASFEFAGVAMVVMALAFGIVEFGSLIRAQAVVTNVTREGGSLASRDIKNGSDLLNLLEASTWPLNFACPSEDPSCDQTAQDYVYKIYITKVDGGTSQSNTPTCHTPLESGSLTGPGITSPNQDANCGLTQELFDALAYNEDYGTSLLSQLTVVKIYYNHKPLTPLAGLLNTVPYFGNGNVQILNFDSPEQTTGVGDGVNDSFLLASKSIF